MNKKSASALRAKFNIGFSFIEVMIAVIVLALGLIPVFSLFTSTSRGASSTIEELGATNYANEIIDNLSAYKYGELPEIHQKTDFDSLKQDPFFSRMRVSPLKPGFKRFLKIYPRSANFKIPAGAGEEFKKQIEKICMFKVIEATVEYSVKLEKGNLNKEYKMIALTGSDELDNFE
ncbi:MAG TPA: hypothetical protein PK467_04000 [Candidatus Wallbacteria bacterium]|nr:hypothetical protein [Candidatus Wallbacteria bacterium]